MFEKYMYAIYASIISIVLLVGSYYAGYAAANFKNVMNISKSQKIYADKLQEKQVQIDYMTDVNNKITNSINLQQQEIKNEIDKNKILINKYNTISHYYVKLLNSSTSNRNPNLNITYTPDAADTEKCDASAVLRAVTENNLNHELCINQVSLWQKWYEINNHNKS